MKNHCLYRLFLIFSLLVSIGFAEIETLATGNADSGDAMSAQISPSGADGLAHEELAAIRQLITVLQQEMTRQADDLSGLREDIQSVKKEAGDLYRELERRPEEMQFVQWQNELKRSLDKIDSSVSGSLAEIVPAPDRLSVLTTVAALIAATASIAILFFLVIKGGNEKRTSGTTKTPGDSTMLKSVQQSLLGLEKQLKVSLERFEKQSQEPTPKGAELSAEDIAGFIRKGNEHIERTCRELLRGIEEKLSEVASSTPSTPVPVPEEEGSPKEDLPKSLQILLPEPFRDGGRLSAWRPLLMRQSLQQPLAAELLARLYEVEAALRNADTKIEPMAEVLLRFSEKAYAWWNSVGERELQSLNETMEPDDRVSTVGEINAQWLGEFKKLFVNRWTDMSIHAFYPDTRFDTDLMIRIEEYSGMRPTVSQPMSWALTESTAGKQRVLFRAKVITH